MQPKIPYIITVVGAESSGKSTLSGELAKVFGCTRVPEYARTYLERLDRAYLLDDLVAIAEGQWEWIQSAVRSPEPTVLHSNPVDRHSPWSGGREPETMASEQFKFQLQSFFMKRHSARIEFSEDDRLSSPVLQKWDNRFVMYQREEFGDEPRPVVIVDSGMLSLQMWARIKYGVSIPFVEELMAKDMTSLYLLMRPIKDWEPDPLREAPSLLERTWIYNQFVAALAGMMLTLR